MRPTRLAWLWPLLLACGSRPAEPTPAVAIETDPAAFQLYVVGGSTAAGVPYNGKADLGRIAAVLLGERAMNRRLEVVNLGASGQDAAYALAMTRAILEHEDDPDHAALLVYSGNNEFLKYDSHSTGERELFDRPLVDGRTRRRTLRSFQSTVETIVDEAQSAGLRVIVSTIGVNLEWEPNRTILANPESAVEMRSLLLEADRLRRARRWRAAAGAYRAGLQRDPKLAWAWNGLAVCYQRLGQANRARHAYRHAITLNGRPSTALPSQNAFLRQLGGRPGVDLLDAEQILSRCSPDGIPGYDVYWDNCHPRLNGYAAVGTELARILADEPGTRMANQQPTIDELRRSLKIEPSFENAVKLSRAQYLYSTSLFIWSPKERLDRSAALLDDLLQKRPNNAVALFSRGVVAFLRKRTDVALTFWTRAYRANPEHVLLRLQQPFLKRLLKKGNTNSRQLLERLRSTLA